MKCPYCHTNDTKVLESRLYQDGYSVRRRRQCSDCEKRFTTYEHFELSMPVVVKRDNRREKYRRNKIRIGIEKACEKRPISTEQIEVLLDKIEKSIFDRAQGHKEIPALEIGNIIMGYLKHLDPVAYVRFASVYRNFQDIDEFVNNLNFDEERNLNIDFAGDISLIQNRQTKNSGENLERKN